MPRYLQLIIGFLGIVLAANLILLDVFFVRQRMEFADLQTKLTALSSNFKILSSRMFSDFPGDPKPSTASASPTAPSTNTAAKSILSQLGALDACPQTCVSLINASTIAATINTPSPPITRTSTSQLLTSAVSQSISRGEFFIPLGSGTVNQSNEWQTVESAQATFDINNFYGNKTAYFEIFVHLPRTNGTLHARLMDTTSGLPVPNTDVETSSTNVTFFSMPITLNTGKRVYKVQLYNTLDQAIVDQARIRVIVE